MAEIALITGRQQRMHWRRHHQEAGWLLHCGRAGSAGPAETIDVDMGKPQQLACYKLFDDRAGLPRRIGRR